MDLTSRRRERLWISQAEGKRGCGSHKQKEREAVDLISRRKGRGGGGAL